MSIPRLALRTIGVRSSLIHTRPLTTTPRLFSDNTHPNTPSYRDAMINKPLNPHMTNTNSAETNELPSAGADKVPPEFISSAGGKVEPKDSSPENTQRMVGGTQGTPKSGLNAEINVKDKGVDPKQGGETPGEMGVGEMEDIEFKVEPLKRTGEDANTMRARLLYQSRKRGTLESDLLMSTFADANLQHMSIPQMEAYDRFLDENDWDIYYWVTQEPTPTSRETAEGAMDHSEGATSSASGSSEGYSDPANGEARIDTKKHGGAVDVGKSGPVEKGKGEWAQTVGTFKPAYRPVPARWRNSEILMKLRKHVLARSAGGTGVLDGARGEVAEEAKDEKSGKGMAFMPEIRNMDS